MNKSPDEVGNVMGKSTTGNSVTGTVHSIDLRKYLIRIQTGGGPASEYKLTDQTEITRDQGIGKLSDVKVGDSVSLQVEIGSTKVTRLHISPPPAPAK